MTTAYNNRSSFFLVSSYYIDFDCQELRRICGTFYPFSLEILTHDLCRIQYARWKQECKEMDSHVGSGRIITAPIIAEDGMPIKDPLVLLEATSDQNTLQGCSTSSRNGNEVDKSVNRVMDKQIIEWKLTLHQIGKV